MDSKENLHPLHSFGSPRGSNGHKLARGACTDSPILPTHLSPVPIGRSSFQCQPRPLPPYAKQRRRRCLFPPCRRLHLSTATRDAPSSSTTVAPSLPPSSSPSSAPSLAIFPLPELKIRSAPSLPFRAIAILQADLHVPFQMDGGGCNLYGQNPRGPTPVFNFLSQGSVSGGAYPPRAGFNGVDLNSQAT